VKRTVLPANAVTAAEVLGEKFPPLRRYCPILLTVSPQQTLFLLADNREAFYGGAVGGGKSAALLMAALHAQSSEGRLIVLVHGLASTAAEMARMLEPLAVSAARFEHDTFISIDKNASELRKLLEEHDETADELSLLCHSRGGLVARAAADLLPEEVSRRTAIHTFGTPHTDTPLADFCADRPADPPR
jgi:pimeloyl-ACP methyl ester carboxylesterase